MAQHEDWTEAVDKIARESRVKQQEDVIVPLQGDIEKLDKALDELSAVVASLEQRLA